MGRSVTTGNKVKKQQVFTVSGTFTPSAALLAAGGVVTVRCVGGGGGGGFHNGGGGGGGSSGMDITRTVTVDAPVAVTIGAGGAQSQHGGHTSFGALLAATGGKPGEQQVGGASSGEGSRPGKNGPTGGAGGGCGATQGPIPAPSNTGGGGAGTFANVPSYSKGASGICIIDWEE